MHSSAPFLVGNKVKEKGGSGRVLTVRAICPVPDVSAPQQQRYIVEWREEDGTLHNQELEQDKLEFLPESVWEEQKQELPTAGNAEG